MRILAIDLGARLVGWAYFEATGLVSAGHWNLQPKRTQSPGVRWLRLRRNLESVIEISGLEIDLVAYEEVRNHTSRPKGRKTPVFNVAAAHAYGGAESHLLAWCEIQKLNFLSVTIADIKRAATGKGGGKGTSKADVLVAARRRWPRIHFAEQDSADAAFIGRAARIEFGIEDA